jgi:hypothetical protein
MPIQLTELLQISLRGPKDLILPDAGQVAVLVRLHPGRDLPACAQLRADFGQGIVSANVNVADFETLRDDPAVIAMTLSRRGYPV